MQARASLLVLSTFTLGCAAGPGGAPESDAPTELKDLEAEPKSWVEALDEAFYGNDPLASRPAAASETEGSKPPASETPRLPPPAKEARRRELRELSLKALLAQRLGRLEDAVEPLEKACLLLPEEERGPYQRALGDVLLSLRRDEEAARMYREAIASDVRHSPPPQSEALYGNLAVAYYRLGDLSGARLAAGRALEIRPGYGEALKTLGLIDLREGEKGKGIERVKAALGSDPEIPEAHVALAESAEAEGEYSIALEHYRSLLQLDAAEEPIDYSRRWRNLFYPGQRPTADVLRDRIGRLEARLAGKTAGRASPLREREREP